MPTVLKKDGFKVVIYFNDHIPAHVHVFKAGSEIKIDVEQEIPTIMEISGDISNKDVTKAYELVKKHQKDLFKRWMEIHGY